MTDTFLSVEVQGIKTLTDLQRLVEVAEALNMPANSNVKASATFSSLTVSTYLSRITLPSELEPEHCIDSACVLGEHDDETSHFDGKSCW